MEKYKKRIAGLGSALFALGVLMIIFSLGQLNFFSIAFGIVFLLLGRSIRNNPGPDKKAFIIGGMILAFLMIISVTYRYIALQDSSVNQVVLAVFVIQLLMPVAIFIDSFVALHAVGKLKAGDQTY